MNLIKKLMVLLTGALMVMQAGAESVWDKPVSATPEPIEIVVYRSPGCGCCVRWEQHLKLHGFKVKDTEMDAVDLNKVKKDHGLTPQLASCHTAMVNNYVIEGHVPANDIKRLLSEKPPIIGLSVPQMPVGTPGMETLDRKDPFKVIAFDSAGNTNVFSEYRNY